MKPLCLLFSMASACLCADPCVVVVDSIEVNEIITGKGRDNFRQVWFLDWDWQQTEGDELQPVPVSRGWHRLRDGDPVPAVIPGIGVIHEFEDGGQQYRVIAPAVTYTITTSDPETRCREIGAYRPICP